MADRRAMVITAEESGRWLIDNCPEDMTMRADVRKSLSKIDTALVGIEERLSDQKAKLENTVMQNEEFMKSYYKVSDKVSSIEFQVSRQHVISLDWNELSKQHLEAKNLSQEVASVKHLFQHLLFSCEKIMREEKDVEKREATKQKMDYLQSRWDTVTKEIDSREAIIESVEIVAHPYHDLTSAFAEWITKTEKHSRDIDQVPTTREELFINKRMVKQFATNVERHAVKHRQLGDATTDMNKLNDKHDGKVTGFNDITDKVADLYQRWYVIQDLAKTSTEKVESLQKFINEYYEQYIITERASQFITNAFQRHVKYGVDLEQGKKEFCVLEDLCSATERANEHMTSLADKSKALCDVIDEYGGDSCGVKEQTGRLSKRFKEIDSELKEEISDTENKNKIIGQFLSTCDEIRKWHVTSVHKLKAIGTVKRAPEEVKEQLDSVNVSVVDFHLFIKLVFTFLHFFV